MMIVFFVIGVIVGSVAMLFIFKARSIGSLGVDTSDPNEKPYLFLELSKNVSTLMRRKYVVLVVKLKNYISQE